MATALWKDERWLRSGTDPDLRRDAAAILEAALRAADPREAVRRFVRLEGDTLRVGGVHYDLRGVRRVLVIGFGKASASMALGLEDVLGDRIAGGLVVVKHGHVSDLRRVEIVEASHPLPDRDGEEGARRLVEILRDATSEDLVLCVISGGGSALLPLPADCLTLEDEIAATDLLLGSGATIVEVNTVRKHLSGVKGGRLAAVAWPAQVAVLVLSDVIGNRLDAIASGPFAADPTTYSDALEILCRYDLGERVPQTVLRHLRRGESGEIPETPKPGGPVFERVKTSVIGSVVQAAEAAQIEAAARGYASVILSTSVEGEAREVGRVVGALAKEERDYGRPAPRPACLILGGETTVTVRGSGRGGRNQELALAASIALDGCEGTLVVAFATDGTDGPTDVAGAVAAGDTIRRARKRGLDARRYLADNDAYTFFDGLGELLRTGPTNTNVNDLVVVMAK